MLHQQQLPFATCLAVTIVAGCY